MCVVKKSSDKAFSMSLFRVANALCVCVHDLRCRYCTVIHIFGCFITGCIRYGLSTTILMLYILDVLG